MEWKVESILMGDLAAAWDMVGRLSRSIPSEGMPRMLYSIIIILAIRSLILYSIITFTVFLSYFSLHNLHLYPCSLFSTFSAPFACSLSLSQPVDVELVGNAVKLYRKRDMRQTINWLSGLGYPVERTIDGLKQLEVHDFFVYFFFNYSILLHRARFCITKTRERTIH